MVINNTSLHKAKAEKNNEFYTQLADIELEMVHYKPLFRDKVVYCNCNDPDWSNFFKYFQLNFTHLGLKKLISTRYEADGKASYMLEITRDNIDTQSPIPTYTQTPLEGNGDFRSDECIALLKEADIVVTNPPFSLFREYITLLKGYDKKYLIIGNINAVTYKEIFPLIKENKMWIGVNAKGGSRKGNSLTFMTDKGEEKDVPSWWYTNLDHNVRHEIIPLFKAYNAEEFPKYDNYEAIEVEKTRLIPVDYDGVMGVPISFLPRYNPKQFEIIGLMSGSKGDGLTNGDDGRAKFYLNGKGVYARVLIKKKN